MISTATGVDVGVPCGDLAKRAGFVRIVIRKVLENAAAPPRGLSVIGREVRARIAELDARLPHTKRRMLEAELMLGGRAKPIRRAALRDTQSELEPVAAHTHCRAPELRSARGGGPNGRLLTGSTRAAAGLQMILRDAPGRPARDAERIGACRGAHALWHTQAMQRTRRRPEWTRSDGADPAAPTAVK